jgi:hypothetical protein
MTATWIPCSERLPPEGEVVFTKIHDYNGCRNEQPLKRQGNLWFFPDGSMYVYYTPTHWHPMELSYEI